MCHTSGTSYAQQSGLVLQAGVSYANLVGATPTNPAAKANGLSRVEPGEAERSLLMYKLHWEPDYTTQDYGSPMPLGGRSLYVGQIEFVRRWIAAGAPLQGAVVDPELLDDATMPDLTPFEPLAPPAAGYQLRVERFGIAPDFEREIFVYKAVGNTTTAFVNRIETKMRVNSHHFVAYTFHESTPSAAVPPLDVIRDLRNPDGSLSVTTLRSMAYHVFFGGAMTPVADWRLPNGVAMRLQPGAAVDLNSHYVNHTDAEMSGEVSVNLHTVDSSEVQHIAQALNLGNFGITLPPGQRTTMTKTFTMSDTTYVLLLTAHMHKRGERFKIRIAGGNRDGEVIYDTDSWSSPAITTYVPAVRLLPGEGLTSEITWFNESGRTITFGLTSEDEMGIIFGYKYTN